MFASVAIILLSSFVSVNNVNTDTEGLVCEIYGKIKFVDYGEGC